MPRIGALGSRCRRSTSADPVEGPAWAPAPTAVCADPTCEAAMESTPEPSAAASRPLVQPAHKVVDEIIRRAEIVRLCEYTFCFGVRCDFRWMGHRRAWE